MIKQNTTISELLREIIQEAKNRRCADCHNQYCGRMKDFKRNKMSDTMTFDHLPQFKKKFDIGWVSARGAKSGVTVKALLEEIAKCEVVCWTCHIKREQRRKKDFQQNRIKRLENRIAAKAFHEMIEPIKRLCNSIKTTATAKSKKKVKREIAENIQMREALAQVFAWFAAFNIHKPSRPNDLSKQQKNLKELGLSIILGCRWITNAKVRAIEINEFEEFRHYHNPLDYDPEQIIVEW